MKSQKAKEFIDGCMAHLTVEMSDHAKWQLRAAMTHAAELLLVCLSGRDHLRG